jgi:uncharacterized protein YbjQ (UPF0145 family)
MFLTTTDNIQGKNVTEYLGIVASVILTVMPGGNKMMGNAIDNFTKQAQEDLERKAAKLGANAVIGLKFTTQGNNFMLLGTAVKLS